MSMIWLWDNQLYIKFIDLDLDDINLLNPSDELTYSFLKSGKNKISGIIIQKSQDLNIDKKFISILWLQVKNI